jgi:hypothetical protein
LWSLAHKYIDVCLEGCVLVYPDSRNVELNAVGARQLAAVLLNVADALGCPLSSTTSSEKRLASYPPSEARMSLARGMGPPDCQGDGTTVARY